MRSKASLVRPPPQSPAGARRGKNRERRGEEWAEEKARHVLQERAPWPGSGRALPPSRGPGAGKTHEQRLPTNRSDDLSVWLNSGSTPPSPAPASSPCHFPPPPSVSFSFSRPALSSLQPVLGRMSLHGSLSLRDPRRVMGRVSFRVRVGSVRRPRSPWQGRRHVCYSVPPRPGARGAASGLSGARTPGEAADGAAVTSPSGIPRFLAAPAPRTPDLWEHCAAARPTPDVSPLSSCARLRPHPSPSPDWRWHPPRPAGAWSSLVFSERWQPITGPACSVPGTPTPPARKLCLWRKSAGAHQAPVSGGRRFRAAPGLAGSDPVLERDSAAPSSGEER